MPQPTALRRTALAALFATLSSATAAHAFQATEAEAERFRAAFEAYVGKPTPGKPRLIDVRPAGEAYDLVLDFDAFIAPFNALGGPKITFGAMTSKLTPEPNGMWKQSFTTFPPFVVEDATSRTRASYEGLAAEGIFDPEKIYFPSTTLKATRLTALSEQRGGDDSKVAATAEVTYEGLDLVAKASPSPSGDALDGTVTQKIARVIETVKVAGGPGMPEVTISIGAYDYDSDVRITGMRHGAALELWRWFVANGVGTAVASDPAGFRQRLAALGTIFDEMSGTSRVRDIGLESPFAIGGAKTMSMSIASTGVTKEGRGGFSFDIGGLTVHSMFLPGWSAKLMPTDLALRVAGDGWNFADPFAKWLELVDFAKPHALTPDEQAKILAIMLPKGAATVDVTGTRIAGANWSVTADGRVDVGPAGAKGEIVVRAEGLEAVSQRLADIRNDKHAADLRTALGAASMTAARDGAAHVWRFGFEGEKVSMNGMVISDKPSEAAPAPTPPVEATPVPPKKSEPGKGNPKGEQPGKGNPKTDGKKLQKDL